MKDRLAKLIAGMRGGTDFKTVEGIAHDYGFTQEQISAGGARFFLPGHPDDAITVENHGHGVSVGKAESFAAYVLNRSFEAQADCRKQLQRTDHRALKRMESLLDNSGPKTQR